MQGDNPYCGKPNSSCRLTLQKSPKWFVVKPIKMRSRAAELSEVNKAQLHNRAEQIPILAHLFTPITPLITHIWPLLNPIKFNQAPLLPPPFPCVTVLITCQ